MERTFSELSIKNRDFITISIFLEEEVRELVYEIAIEKKDELPLASNYTLSPSVLFSIK